MKNGDSISSHSEGSGVDRGVTVIGDGGRGWGERGAGRGGRKLLGSGYGCLGRLSWRGKVPEGA